MAIIDITGAYLHDDKDEHIIILLKVRLAYLMEMIEPKLYRKFFIINIKGGIMLYIKIQKALYGFLRSALFLYKIIVKYLEADRFVLNTYDPFVANNMVNGHQMTVAWHVDDLKVSQKKPFLITVFTAYLDSIYG